MAIKAKPDGYQNLIPYIMIENVPACVEFLKTVFDAIELRRTMMPDGKIGNIELKIGDSVLMLAEQRAGIPPAPAFIYIYQENTDKAFQKAVKAGATVIMEPGDQFYGDRNAGVKDPFGNTWWIASRVENLSDEEIQKRSNEFFK